MFAGQEKNRPKSRLRLSKRLRFILMVMLISIGTSLLVLGSYVAWLFWRADHYDLSRLTLQGEESMLYDANNQLICTLNGEEHRQLRYEDIPEHFIQALLAREDEHFFDHGGVRYISIVRSFIRNVRSGRYAQGGSTITMQLTRNVFELRDKSLDRKALEIALTYLVEARYDKETILTQYLNRIYFGNNCYGLADAAAYYFSKEVKDLDLSESATLVGLVRGPSIFNPVRSMDNAIRVRNETLDRMLEAEMIPADYCAFLKKEPIRLKLSPRAEQVASYPLMAVRRDMKLLDLELGDETSSIAVVSKIHLNIQEHVEEVMERGLRFIEGDAEPDARWATLTSDKPEEQAELMAAWRALPKAKSIPTRQKDGLAAGLQCVVLVVDARLNSKGSALAVMAGRDASDYQNRWGTLVKPGRALAPLVFCAAMNRDRGGVPVVATSSEVTARKLGFNALKEYFASLEVFRSLPDASNSSHLFTGNFALSLRRLARLYYCILYNGVNYEFSYLQGVYSQNRHLLFVNRAKEYPEIIRREAACIVSTLPPFVYTDDSKPRYLNESLLDGGGQWCVVSKPLGVCVFVWVGYDQSQGVIANNAALQARLQQIPLLLAQQIDRETRRILVAEQERAKREAAAKKEGKKK